MQIISIGRKPDNQIVINDPSQTVSSYHAIIKVMETNIFITDKSTNGTKVNGYQIPKETDYPIKRGDSISFANRFYLDWSKIPTISKPGDTNNPIVSTHRYRGILPIVLVVFLFIAILTNPTAERAKQFIHSNSKGAVLLSLLNDSKWGSFFLTSSVCRKNYYIFSVFYIKFDVLLQRQASIPYAIGFMNKVFVVNFNEQDIEQKLKEKIDTPNDNTETKIYFDDCEQF
jgi:FHA domain